MKPGFQSKENLNRKAHELQMSLSNNSPQMGKDRGRFFGNQAGLPKTGSQSISNGNGSSKGNEHVGDGRKTNTLSYSETIGPHTISAYGKKTDISDANTVFGITLKGNHTGIQDCAELQESAHFGGSRYKSNEMAESSPDNFKFEQGRSGDINHMGESLHSTVKSEFIDQNQIDEAYTQKLHRIAELRCNWFQFYTDHIYCSVSSLILVINNIEYNVPFGLAKSLLASRENLETFLKGTTFSSQGEVHVDASFVESIKGSRLDNDHFVTDEEISTGGITAKLM